MMKIVITATEPKETGDVDPRFGRCGYFAIYDTDRQAYEFFPNATNLQAAQGAGIQAGQLIVELGAEILITGNLGPKASSVLETNGIRTYQAAAGTVAEAAAAYLAGSLPPLGGANVEGHWS